MAWRRCWPRCLGFGHSPRGAEPRQQSRLRPTAEGLQRGPRRFRARPLWLACEAIRFAISVTAFRRCDAAATSILAGELTCRINSLNSRHVPAAERPVQYISTRGEAASLGFAEAMLAGLARDGGLYVPEAWPQLDAEAIASFAGRSYAEV